MKGWNHLQKLRPVVYVILFLWLTWLGICDVLLSLLLPISFIFPDLVQELSSGIAFTVWFSIQQVFEYCNGAIVEVSGDAIPAHESAIIVANHNSWTDFYMIQKVAYDAGMLGRCRWFAKKQLKWVPFLGWALWAMGFPLLRRNWLEDEKQLNQVFSGIVDRNWPTWLISFSEATRFTSRKHEETRVWCKENNRPLPKHLLYPRTKGFVSTVQHLKKARHVKAVYDMTIAYAHGNEFMAAPSIVQSLLNGDLTERQKYRFHIHVRRFEIGDLPQTDEGLKEWLEQRWVEKGKWLERQKEQWSRKTSRD